MKLLPHRLDYWPLDAREAWEERAAIRHFEGLLDLGEAEELAELDVRCEWNERNRPHEGWPPRGDA